MPITGHYLPPPPQEVVFGQSTASALAAALARFGAQRVVFVTNRSLDGTGRLGSQVTAALGAQRVATVAGVGAHTPRADVLRIAAVLNETSADLVVGLGGGSVCDAVKAARLCHANGIDSIAGIDGLREAGDLAAPRVPGIAIPTTLSAGEYTAFAGVTDERGPRKEVFFHRGMAPDLVILDAAMTLVTPPRLWFGTGMRAVDHAVESWCSRNVTPPVEATALHALGILPRALRRCLEVPDDIGNRLDCLVGSWLSVQGVATGVDLGASHGIGHVLGGTAGMAHGETSCVMLPHVLRYNAATNAARQATLAAAMGAPTTPLADQIEALVSQLGLPGRLRDADVPRAILPTIASEAMHDLWVKTNPRPLAGPADVLPLLEAAW